MTNKTETWIIIKSETPLNSIENTKLQQEVSTSIVAHATGKKAKKEIVKELKFFYDRFETANVFSTTHDSELGVCGFTARRLNNFVKYQIELV